MYENANDVSLHLPTPEAWAGLSDHVQKAIDTQCVPNLLT